MSNDSKPCSRCNERRFVLCPSCEGTGHANEARTIICYECGTVGDGAIPCPQCNPNGSVYGTDPYR